MRVTKIVRRAVVALASATTLAAAVGACSSSESTDNSCSGEQVDKFKELIVVDDSVLQDARTLNASDGPWSFRYVVEQVAPQGMDTSDFVTAWLTNWVTPTQLNGYPLDLPNEGRARNMQTYVICPWIRSTPSNGCSADPSDTMCTTCTSRKLDLAKAPFRLNGIANRLDLREQVPGETNGEGRMLFALTSGPGDDPSSSAMPMGVNFEFTMPSTRTPKQWAEAWHALGKFGAIDESYKAALQQITDAFVKRGAEPKSPSGSALSQVRTNESALDWIWQLREFQLRPDGILDLVPVHNTPATDVNQTQALADWVNANRDAVTKNFYDMPLSLRGGSSDAFLFKWTLPGVDESLRKSFAQGTCNGCHSEENPTKDSAFHVSPFRHGAEKLSTFMNDPNGTSGRPDDLTQRVASMQRALCGQ